MDSVIGFASTYPLDSGLSDGFRYPAFEQPGPGAYVMGQWLQSAVLSFRCRLPALFKLSESVLM